MTAPTIATMTAQVRDLNITMGWRNPDGTPISSYTEHLAMIGEEIGEATSAYRRWGLDDATEPYDHVDSDTGKVTPAKPEGVGPELADTLIRFLDTCNAFTIKVFADIPLADVAPLDRPTWARAFVDDMYWLGRKVILLGPSRDLIDTRAPAHVLRTLTAIAATHGIDLDAEYTRKMAHNWTREHRHGNKLL